MAKDLLTTSKIKSFIKDHDEKQSVEDAEAKQADRGPKRIVSSISDGGGLKLEVRGTGEPRWVLRYTRPLSGKKNEFAIGIYPDVSLANAREIASDLRGKIQRGIDPAVAKVEEIKEAKAEAIKVERTFGILLDEFLSVQDWADTTRNKNLNRIKNHLGRLLPMPLEEITPRILLDIILRPIDSGETQRRVRALVSKVFQFAIASGDMLINPARDLAPALKPSEHKHYAAATTAEELKVIWQTILSIHSLPTRCALQLQFLTFQRPGNIIAMEWGEIDIDNREWIIPAQKMKLKKGEKKTSKPHIVPLSDYALEVIDVIPRKPSIYCFPSERGMSRHMSDNTMNVALRSYGITKEQTCCHGSRTTANSLANESGLFSADSIERQQAHKLHGGKIRNIYNRADYTEERRDLMKWWGEFLRRLE